MTIDEIRAMLAKITPGPWEINRGAVTDSSGCIVLANAYLDRPDYDAAFIAAAPEIAKFAVEMAEYSARVRKMFDTTRWQITDALGVDRSQSWFSVRSLVTELREENEKLVAEQSRLRAELEMLRGVGCLEDGDGPCGVCIKCLRAEVERLQGIETAAREVLDNPHSIDFYLSELSEVMDK